MSQSSTHRHKSNGRRANTWRDEPKGHPAHTPPDDLQISAAHYTYHVVNHKPLTGCKRDDRGRWICGYRR